MSWWTWIGNNRDEWTARAANRVKRGIAAPDPVEVADRLLLLWPCPICPGHPRYPEEDKDRHMALHGRGLPGSPEYPIWQPEGFPAGYLGCGRYSHAHWGHTISGQMPYQEFTTGGNGGWRPPEAYGPAKEGSIG